jgi:hypothetical protein
VPPAAPSPTRRTPRSCERAIKKIEAGKQPEAALTLKVVRRQMSAAWRGAKYVIRTAPPPVAEADRLHRRARVSGGAAGGVTYASAPETGVRVLTLQHDVATDLAQLVDGSHGTGLNPIATTLNFALDRRDAAIADIVKLAPPAPPLPDDRAPARASQEDAAPTFDALMPGIVPEFDDEIQAIEALKADATDVTAGGLRLLNAAETQAGKTKEFVNTTWPPAPADD